MEFWFKFVKNQQIRENLEFVFRFSWKKCGEQQKSFMDFISYLIENDFFDNSADLTRVFGKGWRRRNFVVKSL